MVLGHDGLNRPEERKGREDLGAPQRMGKNLAGHLVTHDRVDQVVFHAYPADVVEEPGIIQRAALIGDDVIPEASRQGGHAPCMVELMLFIEIEYQTKNRYDLRQHGLGRDRRRGGESGAIKILSLGLGRPNPPESRAQGKVSAQAINFRAISGVGKMAPCWGAIC